MPVNSIREASLPLRIVGGLLGTCLFDYEKFYLNRLYMLAIWTFYACGTVHAEIVFFEERVFATTVGILVLHANGIISMVTASFNASYKKTSDKCFKALCIVDDTLKSLGISLEYQTVYRESLITLTLLLVIYVGISIFTFMGSGYLYSLQQTIYLGALFSYPLLLTYISDFNYWIVLRSIEVRFDQLNRYVDDLSAERENHVRTFSKNTCFVLKSRRNDDSRNNHYDVWIIMKVHQQLNKTSREINLMFGVDFGLQMGVYFCNTIELISFLYVIYIETDKIDRQKAMFIMSHVIFNFLHFTKLVLFNRACENVQRKSNAMEAALTNFINTVHDFELCQDIQQFLMQVKQRPLQFTALGFINVGYNCLASLFTSMAETVIIMIQLGGMTHATHFGPEQNTTTNDDQL